jgi:hypothetical protein
MTSLSRRYVADRLAHAWNEKHPVESVVIWFGPDGDVDDMRETIMTAPARVVAGSDTILVGISDRANPVSLSSLYGAAELRREIEAQIAREGVA